MHAVLADFGFDGLIVDVEVQGAHVAVVVGIDIVTMSGYLAE